jgi:hypothetical protein
MNVHDTEELPQDVAEVGSAYRAAKFDDEPPAQVDEFLQCAARRQAERSFGAYLPPLAAAATILLSVAVVLHLTIPVGDPNEAAFEAGDDLAPASAESGPAPTADVAPPAGETAPAVRELPLRSRAVAPAAVSPTEADAAATCTTEQHADPGAWLDCIEALRETGDRAAAEGELQQLRGRYPDFPVPPELDPDAAP